MENYKNFNYEIEQDEFAENPVENGNYEIIGFGEYGTQHNYENPQDVIDTNKKDYYIFPLRAYIHSGMALSLTDECPFNDQWDSGFYGFIMFKKEKGIGKIKSFEWAKSYIEEYNQWLSGDVYSFIIYDENGEILDSCSGFFGYDYIEREVFFEIDYHINELKKEHLDKLKQQIKKHVPLHYRNNFPCFS